MTALRLYSSRNGNKLAEKNRRAFIDALTSWKMSEKDKINMIIGLHLVYNTHLEIENFLNDKEKVTFNETLDKFHINNDTIPRFEIDGTSDNK